MKSKVNEIKQMLENWNTSGTNSKHDPEFKKFTSLFKSFMKTELEKIKATNIVFSVGHYYISGFFTNANGQPFYFSISDVRGSLPVSGYQHPLMYRTAKDYKDYTGGSNRWINMEEDMFVQANEWGNV